MLVMKANASLPIKNDEKEIKFANSFDKQGID